MTQAGESLATYLPVEEGFTTIKVRKRFRRWLKLESAKRGVPMYLIAEIELSKLYGGVIPWEDGLSGAKELA